MIALRSCRTISVSVASSVEPPEIKRILSPFALQFQDNGQQAICPVHTSLTLFAAYQRGEDTNRRDARADDKGGMESVREGLL